MKNILSLIGRNEKLFETDINQKKIELEKEISCSRFLVLGGAGSIGQAVTKEIFKRNPIKLHVVDISENNLVELVRDIRSTYGYITGDFQTFALDIGSIEYDAFINADGQYDYVLNLSALKHVRSEKDPFTLMRMINVNIFNTKKTIQQSIKSGVKKYFCVSTDKAANPVNMMGASKRIMEMFLMRESEKIKISMARFANVAFSDGSLLHGFNQRIQKSQPLVAPHDIKRYFVTPQESGELCLMSCIFGDNRDIFFPKLNEALHLISFADIARLYLKQVGYEPYVCDNEDEARSSVNTLSAKGMWPCLFTDSDTTGEKDFEEFFTENETLDLSCFDNLGIIKNKALYDSSKLEFFEKEIIALRANGAWQKNNIIELFKMLLPEFSHKDTGKYLDGKM
ncbi:UDP-N-acetylglucosamine 4,6-dehydratase [Mixta tenebrionis]|uniref:UDP-N-acetylglucosamine 4,6-dehydratase n=1 Tax=Mixta tenebrionis TaxID=2562439 RepID=A0A506VB28_9GAMM|nr:UDP-N-acetylglucosamine 4,6-dehydratase [Mixta tenebrionis]TPW42712.1 UDP-N-acetylglucosamine 4,6-dehydratase [Mixta tenebrionis]